MDVEVLRRRRALSRALSRLASAPVADVLAHHAERAPPRPAWRIGVTGSPGVGKSTLIGRLARHRLDAGRAAQMAVLAIDPTSPLTGGSLLGDRIRMDAVADDPRLFIRSLPSRRSHDGLTDNLPDLLLALEENGYGEVVVETVGIGQVEYTVRTLVDSVVLVLHPEAGDAVQAMKAGILEVADVYVVNKADLPGARRTLAEIRAIAGRTAGESGWTPPVVAVAQGEADGLAALDDALERHRAWLSTRRDPQAVARARTRQHVLSLITRRLEELADMEDFELFGGRIDAIFDTIVQRLAGDRR
ncbi:hypothetical protein [Azospirillum sp.]|uniref:ArgK/MeaB family GTPase n=1 Tax=Azospirillum sp. TaxID=34012 RepID=UPI002D4E28DA|nr:hypothetical protein [Azospirillum sp.]HYD66306.1 hypothetical protein [Azospirillum sp.]